MVISEVIKKLQETKQKHGDVEVEINGWEIKEDDFNYCESERSLVIYY